MSEKQQDEMENTYWQAMNDETKDLCEKTIAEVKKLMPKDTEVSLLSEIPLDVSTKICEMEGVRIDDNLLSQATNSMALAKYLRIVSDDMKITEKVKEDLSKLLNKNKFDWYVSTKLDNTVFISNKLEVNSEEKPKSLSLRYKYDPDEETIKYSLLGQTWNWEISKNLLLMILNNEVPSIYTENVQKCENLDKTNGIELKVGDVIISIKHK